MGEARTKEEWLQAIDDFSEISLSIGNSRVTWEYIGEGYEGDWQADDPEDEPLLRFSCSRLRVVHDPEWMELPDSSYCTDLTVDESRDNLIQAALSILDCIQGTEIYKRKLEEMSWINHDNFKHKVKTDENH